MGKKTYPVTVLINFYTLDPQPANASLFGLSSDIFSRFSMMTMLGKHISLAGLAQFDYSSHNFCKSIL